MPPAVPQSLASTRERRQTKPTERVQQMLEQQQERIERDEQAKEKTQERALSKRQANLINDKGDELMYKPVKSYVAPTITGDDDLDLQRAEDALANHLLYVLAHRGDGDWSLHYRSGVVGLALLQEAHNHPSAKVIERAIGDLALTSVERKGKAKAVDNLGDSRSAVGSPTNYSGITIGRSPQESVTKQEDTRATPQLRYPPASTPAPAATTKRHANFDDNPALSKKPRVDVPIGTKPSAPVGSAGHGAAPVSVSGNPKLSQPHARSQKTETSLKAVTFGSQSRAVAVSDSQPNNETIQPTPQESSQSRPSHDNRGLATGPSVVSHAAVQPPAPSLPAHPVQNRIVREKSWLDDKVPQPRSSKPGVMHPSTSLPRHQVDASERVQQRLADYRAANPKRRPATANQGETDRARVDEARVDESQADEPQADEPPVDKPRVDKLRVDKPRVDKPRVNKSHADRPPPGQPRANQPQGNPSLDRPKTPASQPKNKGRVTRPPRNENARVQDRARPVLNPEQRQPHRRNRATPEDEGGDEVDERRRGNHNQRRLDDDESTRPTIRSFRGEERKVVKIMVRKAKPWIIACGTFSWRPGDPCEVVPDIDDIVGQAFAYACRLRAQRYTLLTEHITCVKSLVTSYRSDVKDTVLLVVEKFLGFIDGDKPHNRELVQRLLPDTFHERDPEGEEDRRPFESDFFFKVVARALFGPGKLGLNNAARFAPIPVRFLAFLCTMCNHVIYCYRHGAFNQDEHLHSSIQEEAFQGYLDLFSDMRENRKDALEGICASWYDRAREESGYNVVARVERPPRRWAPDIAVPYVPRFVAPPDELDDYGTDDDDRSAYGIEHGHKEARTGTGGGRRQRSPDRNEDSDGEESDDDNHGEGPSKPYGAQLDDIPSPKGWVAPCDERDLSDEEMVPSDAEMDE